MQVATVDSVGRSSGLVSIWNPDVFTLEIVVKNHRFLLTAGRIIGLSDRIYILNLHAPNDPGSRRLLWEEIAALLSHYEGVWVLFGDFNEVRAEEERVNSRFDRGVTNAFNGFITRLGLLEYHMCGEKLAKIVELNLAVANDGISSDVSSDVFLANSLWNIKKEIKKWRQEVAAAENKEVKEMIDLIGRIEKKAEVSSISQSEKSTRVELRLKLKKLEHLKGRNLQQKARVNWIRFGDENSSFFHRVINVNIANNIINGLRFRNLWISDPVELKSEVRSWFKKQFLEPIRRRPKFTDTGLPKFLSIMEIFCVPLSRWLRLKRLSKDMVEVKPRALTGFL
ncbi:uncharacterized protein LOC110866534 [Helianthus annuus]|uniref:uncharacterized protein LOC110866534 n=1 Tax=Helianthus annuus TaxID=4232 RepID=UPI000B9074E4|nr:uncharacterized protein LOC110866534 [Helianthus annuus]